MMHGTDSISDAKVAVLLLIDNLRKEERGIVLRKDDGKLTQDDIDLACIKRDMETLRNMAAMLGAMSLQVQAMEMEHHQRTAG